MAMNPKPKRLLTDALLLIVVLVFAGFLIALAFANMGASMEAERAQALIERTRDTCVKYANSETVTSDFVVKKAELYRCPDGKLVALQK